MISARYSSAAPDLSSAAPGTEGSCNAQFGDNLDLVRSRLVTGEGADASGLSRPDLAFPLSRLVAPGLGAPGCCAGEALVRALLDSATNETKFVADLAAGVGNPDNATRKPMQKLFISLLDYSTLIGTQ